MNRAGALPGAHLPSFRILPVVSPAGTTRLPLWIVFGYVVATFFLFLGWPIDWES